jgi:hypothetical protein
MPVLESTDKFASKSVLRHRPIGGGKPMMTTPVAQRASRSRPADVDSEIVEWKRKTVPTEMHQAQAGKRGITVPAPKKLPQVSQQRARKFAFHHLHPLYYLGLGMVVMVLLWVILSPVFGWFTDLLDDLHYGMPRTTQVDAYVGHEAGKTPSHFIAYI